MRRYLALLVLGTGGLLLTPGAVVGVPDVPGDPTPPSVTPVIVGALGLNGWYTTNVTVNWTVQDPESTILSTSGCDARTLSTDSVGVTLSCTAESDGGITTITKPFKVDKTAPTASASAARGTDSNGWYNHAVAVGFSGDDATSGLDSCTPPQTYGGPDAASVSVSGSCRDKAGNSKSASLSLKYDATPPQMGGGSASRAADANGWYNHALTVSFAGTDTTSGVDSCTSLTYSGPDDASTSVNGSCKDLAGNQSATAAFTLKYDETAPTVTGAGASRPPDANGWYNRALTVNFTGSDATSGVDTCTQAGYSGPDNGAASVSGSCRDRAGNQSGSSAFALAYDATAPQVTGTPSRAADANGWYNRALSVSFSGTDATSGVASCVAPKTYSGPDAEAGAVAGTCTDAAGNVGSRSLGVKFDQTPPVVTASAGRAADANGWYNHALTVSFSGADATSGPGSCVAPKTYSAPDSATASVSGSCTDVAGNTGAQALGFKYDQTAPQVTGSTPSRVADANGWYNHPLTVAFQGTDAISGVDSCAQGGYNGPDSASAAVSGSCRDRAGNQSAPGSFPLKYDATAPVVTATPSRPAGANGWYNSALSVSFAGSDATSKVSSCVAPKSYSAPDSVSAAVDGTCTDFAGNVGSGSFPLKYDQTPPTVTPTPARNPDVNGWYNQALAVSFAGADATSGIDTCTAPLTYSGPDSAAASVSGSCTDKAANSTARSFPLKFDQTPPVVTASAGRAADANGWYNHALTVSFSGADATSGPGSCVAPKTYSAPDSATASVSGSCTDVAGNTGAQALGFKYDQTAPQVTGSTPSRVADANGWYNHPLTVAFQGTDAISGVDSCAQGGYNGPDSASAAVSGSCRDRAGNQSAPGSFPLKYDATAPVVSGATPSREADKNGWYNRALTVAFRGADATSGIGSCTQVGYSGPDSATTSVSGSCSDLAANQSAVSAFGLKYDATAPQVTATPARIADANGWYNHALTVSFTGTDATSQLDSCEAAKTYPGPDSANASVSGTCSDKAGNTAAGAFSLKYDATDPQVTASASRAVDVNGWYNHPLSVSFAGADVTSGIASCDAAKNYGTPDSPNAVVSGKCLDQAGNDGLASFALKYDATGPQVTAAPDRAANANGWYRAPVTVKYTGSDTVSGVASCAPEQSYAGPDAKTASVSGSCSDQAGNTTGSAFALKYDATAPQVSSAPARGADANGWYNHPVAVAFAGADITSGIESCAAPAAYSGPDKTDAAVSGSCRDLAGNTGDTTFGLKYDATAPVIGASAREADANGWYNHALTVSFTGGDATSGLDSCADPVGYAGPDRANASVGGTCRDRAGNTSARSFLFAYDATAPEGVHGAPGRPPDANGWYNDPLAIDFNGTDATSGIDHGTCTKLTYAGPDTDAAALAGSCSDRAGNASAPSSFALKYDATEPLVTNATAVRSPDQAGWYNRPVAFTVQGNDSTAGIASCPTATYAGPDATKAAVTAACLDKAGNRGVKAFPLQYDATGPQVAVAPGRQPDRNGWYNHPVDVAFSGSDPVSGLASCVPPESYDGPDSGFALVVGSCLDKAGNVGAGSVGIGYDTTAPQVTGAQPDRQPDANGWYNRPLVVDFVGSDAISEVEACTRAGYGGPDALSASVAGSCRDRAGNESAASAFGLKYDGTRPSLERVRVKAGNRIAELTWAASADTAVVEIARSASGRAAETVVYRGTGSTFTDRGLANGVRYRYRLTAYDDARNAASSSVDALPIAPLYGPPAGATVVAPPLLDWQPVPKATYYNVQVWRERRMIFSAWPSGTSKRLTRSWTYDGRRYRLTPGLYRWYVWPGFGSRAAKRYGKPLGSSTFVVARTKTSATR